MKTHTTFILFWFMLCSPTVIAQSGDRLTPLPPNAIQLSGYLEDDIQNSIAHWNKGVLPYSKFVDFFRNGRPQFALGEMWGKAVRSGCMFYRYTQDPELKRIMDATVKDLLSTQRANGSISCVPPRQQPDGPSGDLWERKYVMLGLEEYYEWVNRDPAVLESLVRQADCIISQIGKAPKTEITDLGWSAVNVGFEPCHIESGTLLEPFMRLYKWTGHQRYLDFATYIVESGGTKYFNVLEQAYNHVDPYLMAGNYPKAYEMTSLFEGLVEYYRATGDPKWKQTVLNYYSKVRDLEITIIGNGGGDRPYHPNVYGEAWNNTALEQSNPDITRMMETCTGVTWMKFCSQLLRLTGESAVVDEIEKYIYNGLLGAMKPGGDGFSYVNLFNGPKVTNEGWGWDFDEMKVTCCNLNGPMGLAYIPYIAVMSSADGPVVNLYNAGIINMNTPAQKPLQLTIETDYPLSGNAVVRVNPKSRETFTLRLRIPGWSEKTTVKINGKTQPVTPGQYAAFHREWKDGDRIEIAFDMTCRVMDAPHGSNPKAKYFQAVKWGPIVLARDEKIDANYNQPVSIKADKNNIVEVTQTKPTLPSTRMEFIVPAAAGDIRMVDYASVDAWGGTNVCTWLPTNTKQEEIPIMAWYGVQESTIDRYLELKESGITHNFTSFSNVDEMAVAMNAAHVAGIKMLVACPELKTEPEQTATRFRDYPAIAGYSLRDEPASSDFAELGAWARRIQSVDSQHFCYVNLFPNYATAEQLGNATYREHVQQFIREVPLPFISFDHYPIMVDATGARSMREEWYENLEIIADEARKAGKPFWAFALTVALEIYPVPTMAEIRLQVYSNLAYGAQGIQYFTYWTPQPGEWDFHHAPIDYDTRQRTEVFDMIKQMNQEIKALSHVFLDATVVSTRHAGLEIPKGTDRIGKLPEPIKSLEVEGEAIVSVLTKGDFSFLVIVNRDFKNAMAVTVEGSPGLQRILKDGRSVPANRYQNRMAVEPGDVLIYSWKKKY